MRKEERAKITLQALNKLFPNADCELDFKNNFELLIAVVLSAQTTDKAVNKVTPQLFQAYPTPSLLAKADILDVERLIQKIGLYKTKAKNIVLLSKTLVKTYNGVVPSQTKDLILLPGVGNKTAEVVRAVGFNIPAFAVDTHVMRVSKRIGLVKSKIMDPTEIGRQLKRLFPRENWIQLHHQMIFFGRYHCEAKKPRCNECPLFTICKYEKKMEEV